MDNCNKTKFASEKDAVFYITKLRKTSKRDTIPIRSYKCWCGAWHLSSKKSHTEMLADIERLEKENVMLKSELDQLRNAKTKEELIEVKIAVRKDELVAKMQKEINKLTQTIKRMRKDNEELIMKNLRTENKLNQKQP